MKYMGSKNRIAKYILPIILKDRKEGQWYIEPFCGGCNTIDKVTGKRMASDSHFELIELFRSLQQGWLPPKYVSELEYQQAKQLVGFPHLKGYIGFNLSFGAKWFGGYRRDSIGSRNYSLEAYNNITKQIPGIQDIKFYQGAYTTFDSCPPNSIIYCDPPYKGTTKYKGGLDYEHFYQWCRNMKVKGHTIFVSEYNMPDDFICVWEKLVTVNLTNLTLANSKIEKLFTL
jgi:DNA adenine methylase